MVRFNSCLVKFCLKITLINIYSNCDITNYSQFIYVNRKIALNRLYQTSVGDKSQFIITYELK